MLKTVLTLFGIYMLLNVNLFSNPLLEPYNTPFGVPPFDKIKNEHFVPAMKFAMEKHKLEIDAIIKNNAAPNFDNTIVALEQSGELLNDIATVFYNLSSANTNDELQAIAQELSPMLSAHSDDISMNDALFKKVKAVYNNKASLNLSQVDNLLLEDTYKSFVRSGANLDNVQKEKLKEINQKLSILTLKFGENMLKDVNTFKLVIDNKNDLKGLPQSLIDAASETAHAKSLSGKYVFTLQNPSVMPFLTYSDNRDLRKKMQQAYINRGNNNNEFDNKSVINEIVNLRLERANLLGYKTHADFTLEESMAKTPSKVYELLEKLWEPSLEVAKKEAAEMQKMIDAEGSNFKLEAWDWRYYAEKVRKVKYDLNEEELKPYFKLENVKQGIFDLTGKLYGITFKERKDIPKYSDEAIVYEVLDSDGSHLGILYMDFHPRASKRSGAWMTNYREQHIKDGKNITPVISLVCNFSRPTGDLPALLSWDETETFFHEFGHGLHGLFSKCKYKSQAGTSVPRDFVELPSQIMEHWVSEPIVLRMFAKHYITGETIPQSLIDKIKNSSMFNQGFATVEFLASALLDMKYHTIDKPVIIKADEFQKNTTDEIGLIPEISYRHGSTHFSHIFSGGYSSGYYSYLWAGVLDSDAFEAFKETDILSKKTAASFRENILSKGKTDDPMILYKNFRGREPIIEPLLKARGLK